MKPETNCEFSLALSRSGLSAAEAAEQLGFSRRTIYRWIKGEAMPRNAALTALRTAADGLPVDAHGGGSSFRFIDLFAGIGGMRRAFERIGGHCVFTSEWDSYARKTYLANYQVDHTVCGDIREIHEGDIPDHEVLLAGFPCQPFSIAGVSKKNALNRPHGFACDAQGTLFFDVARILRERRPVAFLLENVKNLLSHDRGRTFEVILRTLRDELGYSVQWRVIDARSWVPQQRKRIFLSGFRESTGFSFDHVRVPDSSAGPRLGDILHSEDGSERPEGHYTRGAFATVNDKYVLSNHLWDYLQRYAEKHRERGNGFGFGLVGADDVARTLSARYFKDGSEILVRREQSCPRRLTPRECARLMGFDSAAGAKFVIPVSDTQAYRQFGNAVVAPVVAAVAHAMAPWIAGGALPEEDIRQMPLPLVAVG